MSSLGPVGRVGLWTATHFRAVLAGWLLVAVAFGVFAPRVETALSGAGWEATGSQSVQARQLIQKDFHGLSQLRADGRRTLRPDDHSRPCIRSAVVARVERTLRSSAAVSTVVAPTAGRVDLPRRSHRDRAGRRGARLERDGRRGRLASRASSRRCRASGVQVHLTGASGMWSDFNAANRSAMLKSEVISWPVTLRSCVLAFGSLVAAGLPLMLTMLGLLAAAGSLYLGTRLMPISIWAMNFALMFALALGIDYALFVVHRFRGAFVRRPTSPPRRPPR